ncbi:NAP1-related protein 1-like isoform X2 [Solanum dulcamara]|uniref:NAP1-related protein 1-like isoform X2 n=1 Tax=Solanum dulcamara TaxID=45834 RepID=UPI002484DAB9|nr:NAP1-related protein 1-like isoform X2 [Solanum dulcamara]
MNISLSDKRMETYGGGSRWREQKRKVFDWELDINNMAQDIQFLLKGMEYVSEQEKGEALSKIWDLKMEHMELITNARADLNKRTNCGTDELSIKMENDKRNKKQRKIEKLAEDDENNNIIDNGKQLVLLQQELEKINQEASGELLKVAQKYNRIRQPIYEKRRDIIKDIPGFWSTAFLKHHVLGGLVCTEQDRKIFEFLSSINVELSQDVKSGYTIIFNFDSNEYFENTKLWKKYGRTKTTASSIQWAQGKGVDELSFFNWYSEVDKRDEIGEMIKDELWSDPLICFHHDADEESVDDVAVKNNEDEVVKDTEDEEQNDDND